MAVVRHKAAIHSGHFMVSDFEPDEQDEEDAQVDTPTRGPRATRESSVGVGLSTLIATTEDAESETLSGLSHAPEFKPPIKISKYLQTIRYSLSATNEKDVPLTKLFKSMCGAYKKRITSPRWNRFSGLKLRWKDKIRMNNVIWRCWHMQFMKNEPRTLCAFANPLEIDNHNKMEGTTLLEGKYWKRKLEKIRHEYSKWRHVYYSQHEDPSGNGDTHIQPTSGGGNSVNSYGDYNNEWENYLKSPNHQLVEGTRDDVDLQSMLNEEGIIVDLLLNTFQDSTSANSELSSFLAAVFEIFPESLFFLNYLLFFQTHVMVEWYY